MNSQGNSPLSRALEGLGPVSLTISQSRFGCGGGFIFALIPVVMRWLLPGFAHVTTVKLSWHVRGLVAVAVLLLGSGRSEFSVAFEL